MQQHPSWNVIGPLCLALAIAWGAQDPAPRVAEFEELTVERLNVVDADGTPQVVIACAERFPLPRLQGKEWPRQIDPAGIVFYDETGEECGGLASVSVPGGRAVRLILDVTNSEGIGLGTFDDAADAWSAGITLADRVRVGQDVLTEGTSGTPRIEIQNERQNASVELLDTHGRVRIRLRVVAQDRPVLQILDEDGEVAFEAP